MQQSFVTGLKLKNSLSNQLVFSLTLRNSSSLGMVKRSAGTLADPLSTHRVTWDMPGILLSTQKLHLQRYDKASLEGLLWLQHTSTINLTQLCMNITDVDDKIINRSKEEGVEYF